MGVFLTFHPATLLASWGALAILMQRCDLAWLTGLSLLLVPTAVLFAADRVVLMIRRSRWLLLSVLVLFLLATPGERLPGVMGDIGMTFDGLVAGLEQFLRLLLLLTTLAWLHQRLGSQGMVAGIHRLLFPLSGWRDLRERIVVRLLLVLENVDSEPAMSWRQWLSEPPAGDEAPLLLADRPIVWSDRWLLAATALLLLGVAFW